VSESSIRYSKKMAKPVKGKWLISNKKNS
jgi:hypothetical protein